MGLSPVRAGTVAGMQKFFSSCHRFWAGIHAGAIIAEWRCNEGSRVVNTISFVFEYPGNPDQ